MSEERTQEVEQSIPIRGTWIIEVYRAQPDGSYVIEPKQYRQNLWPSAGSGFLANRIGVVPTNSAMAYMAVGTTSTAVAVGNTTLAGEVSRKAYAVNNVISTNVWQTVNTWGGGADAVGSVSLVEAGTFNAAGSGAGTMANRVTFAAVVLANSDFLNLTLLTEVGTRS